MTASTLLLVDDDGAARRVAGLALTHVGGWQVEAVSSGPAAIEAIAGGVLPDVVLLDLIMPEMNGYEVLRQLRRDPRTSEVPVIFFTGQRWAQERPPPTELGVAGVIAKPFDPMRLPVQVRRLLTDRAPPPARPDTVEVTGTG